MMFVIFLFLMLLLFCCLFDGAVEVVVDVGIGGLG